MQDNIVVKGAREHNLKDISVTLPREKFIVITGLSGSGKSTLAFDTIYAEGQRRYVESLSSYARQFLGLMNKPDVDSIDGLSPAISIEQKTTSKNPRSTVGTITEIYDYLRLLFARIGTPFCPNHNIPIERQSPTKITDNIIKGYTDKTVLIISPLIRDKKGTYETLVKDLHKAGYERVRINGIIQGTDEQVKLERYKKHNIDVIIDEIVVEEDERDRLQEAVENALGLSEGLIIVSIPKGKKYKDQLFSENMSCPKCDVVFEELQPRMFSFNTPYGACETCNGLGIKQEISMELLIPDMSKSIMENGIAIYGRMNESWRIQQLKAVGDIYGFDMWTPFSKYTKKQMKILLYGINKPINAKWSNGTNMHMENGWEGIINQTMRLYLQTDSDYRRREIEKFMIEKPCPSCQGMRLKPKILSVKIDKKSIIDVTDLSIEKSLKFFTKLKLNEEQSFIAKSIMKELKDRLTFLNNVGLGYLTLSRNAGTLSGGEAQRIRLATQIGSNLTGVLYVLDEPSIGLHQRDNVKLIETLHKLRDLGNTLIVVEHDEETIENADYVVDMGPYAGIHGGNITATGTPDDIKANKNSLTGQYLSRKKIIPYRKERRKPTGFFEIKGARANNLKNINVKLPKGIMTVITGVSGSGKSTLIHQILYRSLMKKIYKSRLVPGDHNTILNIDDFEQVIVIDQSPIGKTPRSNPATYTKVFDEIRNIFAMTAEAKLRGYKPGRFSFNVKGGRCEKCSGDGTIKIEMNFLPDVYVECDECKGKRYNRETLEVYYKGKNISDVLNMAIEEAAIFFENIPTIKRKMDTLVDVGLGYLKLGQTSTTLSGGESQRIKLTRELSKRTTKQTIYLLDEPTTGLHFHDINNLLSVLNRLVDNGSTMMIIEHNFDVIKNADYIVDLGPEGGDGGGEVITYGPPEEVVKKWKNKKSKDSKSYTAKFLAKELKK